MASRGGKMAAGSDGGDHVHRERVEDRYKVIICIDTHFDSNTNTLSFYFLLHTAWKSWIQNVVNYKNGLVSALPHHTIFIGLVLLHMLFRMHAANQLHSDSFSNMRQIMIFMRATPFHPLFFFIGGFLFFFSSFFRSYIPTHTIPECVYFVLRVIVNLPRLANYSLKTKGTVSMLVL